MPVKPSWSASKRVGAMSVLLIEPLRSSTSSIDGVIRVGVKLTAGHIASGPGSVPLPLGSQLPSDVHVKFAPHWLPFGVHIVAQVPSGLQWNPAGHVFAAPGVASHCCAHAAGAGTISVHRLDPLGTCGLHAAAATSRRTDKRGMATAAYSKLRSNGRVS